MSGEIIFPGKMRSSEQQHMEVSKTPGNNKWESKEGGGPPGPSQDLKGKLEPAKQVRGQLSRQRKEGTGRPSPSPWLGVRRERRRRRSPRTQ